MLVPFDVGVLLVPFEVGATVLWLPVLLVGGTVLFGFAVDTVVVCLVVGGTVDVALLLVVVGAGVVLVLLAVVFPVTVSGGGLNITHELATY